MNQEWTRDRIAIEVPHMLNLLADSLYPSPAVAVRELLANAVDGVLKKKAMIRADPNLDDDKLPQITVYWDPHGQTLRITDTGCGIKPEEIRQCLGTIGVSGTRVFRDGSQDREIVKQMIGTFGIGLLSSYKLGDTLTIKTRSIGVPENKGIEWQAIRGEPEYQVREIPMARTGTIVEVRAGRTGPVLDAKLYEWVKLYGDLLPLPICDNTGRQLNSFGKVPWEGKDDWQEDTVALEEFIMARLGANRPLWVVPIGPEHGLEVRGVLYVPDDASFVNIDGHVDLYSKRMLVRPRCPDVLPENMVFYDGVIDCWDLHMSMSREEPMRDSAFENLRVHLKREALHGLGALAGQFKSFQRVQSRYDHTLKAAAVNDDQIFHTVAGSLAFFIGSNQRMTLAEYAKAAAERTDESKDKLYYIPTSGSLLARYQVDQVLAQKKLAAVEITAPLPLPDGTQPKGLDLAVLEKFAAAEGLEVVRADHAAGMFKEKAQDPKWLKVEAAFTQVLQGRPASISTSPFQPEELPVLLRAPDTKRDMDGIERFSKSLEKFRQENPTVDVPGELATLMGLAEQTVENKSRMIDVIINANNPMMVQFAEVLGVPTVLTEDDVFTLTCEIWNTALAYNGLVTDPTNMSRVLTNRMSLLKKYLDDAMALSFFKPKPGGEPPAKGGGAGD